MENKILFTDKMLGNTAKVGHMDESLLTKLLKERKESDWYDFKSRLKIYEANGKPVEKVRDELLKDILGFANGNSHTIRKTKFIIIGVDNEKFDKNDVRLLHHVDYKIPEQSELVKWLNSAASPAVVGIESELMDFQGVKLWVITIQPTFELHETARELKAQGNFQKHTVFMRRDEHTEPASVREGVTIQQLKHLHRQEILNPSAIWLGIVVGGLVGLTIGGAKISILENPLGISETIANVLFTLLGVFFGGIIGFVMREFNGARHDWPHMTNPQKTWTIIIVLLAIIAISLFSK